MNYLPSYQDRFCVRSDIYAFNRDKPPAGEERDSWLAEKLTVKLEIERDAFLRQREIFSQEEYEEERVFDASSVRINKIRQMEVFKLILNG